jgi:hypothetical protein
MTRMEEHRQVNLQERRLAKAQATNKARVSVPDFFARHHQT